MLPTQHLLAFLLTVYVLILIPGPSFVGATNPKGVIIFTAREWLGRSSRRLEWMTAGGGVTLTALGFGLALTSRRS